MKVSFTQKEYTRLLELAHLGLWMAGARPDDPATMPERYADLNQKLLALAEPFGCADLVEVDVNGQSFLNEKLTDGPAAEKIDRFVEDAFWSELVSRLAERDLRPAPGAASPTAAGTASCGTEAAAATAVVFDAGAALEPEPARQIALDRPFVFLIRHEATGAVMFTGRVVDPANVPR
jgi:hypothetical protein